MAQLPRYTSQRQFNATPARPVDTTGSERLEAIAKPIIDLTAEWEKAATVSQLNAFKAQKNIFSTDLINRAKSDPDQNNVIRYQEEIDKYKQNALTNMRGVAKREAEIELYHDTQLMRLNVRNIFNQKVVENSIANYNMLLNNNLDTINGENYQSIISNAQELTNQNIYGNIISSDEGKRIMTEYKEKAMNRAIDNDLYSNPELFLQKENDGIYKFTDEKQRVSKISAAEGLIKAQNDELNRLKKAEMISNRLNIISNIASKKITEQEYAKIISENFGTDYELAEAIQKVAQKGGFTADDLDNQSNQAFVDLAEKIFKETDTDKIGQFLISALDQPNKISRDRLAGLVYAASKRTEDKENNFWTNLFESIKDTPKVLGRVLSIFSRENPTEQDAENIVKEEIYAQVDKTSAFGLRADGTKKGKGFFGELERPDGGISTELSIGVEIDGKEVEIPSLVPTLTRKEVNYLLEGNEPTPEILEKAISHAKERLKANKSPFADEKEPVNSLPVDYSEEDIEFTMKKHNLSRAEVLKRLGVNK